MAGLVSSDAVVVDAVAVNVTVSWCCRRWSYYCPCSCRRCLWGLRYCCCCCCWCPYCCCHCCCCCWFLGSFLLVFILFLHLLILAILHYLGSCNYEPATVILLILFQQITTMFVLMQILLVSHPVPHVAQCSFATKICGNTSSLPEQLEGLRKRCKLNGVWGGAPAANDFAHSVLKNEASSALKICISM